MQQTVLGAALILSCHPENDHHDVHHHPAAANGDHPNQGHLQEVQRQIGGKNSVQVKATICTGLVQSLCIQHLHPSDHCVEKPKPQF